MFKQTGNENNNNHQPGDIVSISGTKFTKLTLKEMYRNE